MIAILRGILFFILLLPTLPVFVVMWVYEKYFKRRKDDADEVR